MGRKRAWSPTAASTSSSPSVAQPLASKRSKSLMGEQVTAAQISALFHMKLSDAAAAMGVGRTFFKKLCRKKGIHTWPHHTHKLEKAPAMRTPSVQQAQQMQQIPVSRGQHVL
jgi:predicted secreted protein